MRGMEGNVKSVFYEENFQCLINIKTKHFPYPCNFEVSFFRNPLLLSLPGLVTPAGTGTQNCTCLKQINWV